MASEAKARSKVATRRGGFCDVASVSATPGSTALLTSRGVRHTS